MPTHLGEHAEAFVSGSGTGTGGPLLRKVDRNMAVIKLFRGQILLFVEHSIEPLSAPLE